MTMNFFKHYDGNKQGLKLWKIMERLWLKERSIAKSISWAFFWAENSSWGQDKVNLIQILALLF